MKKIILPIALLFSTLSYGQCKYSKNAVDPFTGHKIVSTDMAKVPATSPGRNLYVSASTVTDEGGGYTYLSVALLPSPKGCVSSDSKAIFLWPDGGTETVVHAGKINCSTPSHLMPVSTESRLFTEAPSAVRLYYSEGYVDVTLGGDDVVRHLQCSVE